MAPEPRPAPIRAPDSGAEERSQRRGLVLALAVVAVWAMLLASPFVSRPLFLVRPPITRRTGGFFEFHGPSCAYSLGHGNWTDVFQTVLCTEDTAREYATCGDTPQRHWRFSAEAAACGARRHTPAEARALLGGQRLVFAGDSIARHLYGAALRLLGEPGQQVVVGHQDFHHELQGNISLQFFWAPYPQNLTGVLAQLQGEGGAAAAGGGKAGRRRRRRLSQQQHQQHQHQQRQRQQPHQQRWWQRALAAQDEMRADEQGGGAAAAAAGGPGVSPEEQQRLRQPPALVTLSTFLWHLLHVTTADDFGEQLGQLKTSAAAYTAAAAAAAGKGGGAAASAAAAGGVRGGGKGGAAPRLVLASGTETFPNRMKTEEKQKHMTPSNLDSYNAALQKVGLLAPAGPFSLLDLFPLTQQCGEECSTDGVHSVPEVYDAALQLLLSLAGAPEETAAAAGQAAEEELHS